VATFIPIIAALYLFLTLLEEVGYMARAAFVMDKISKKSIKAPPKLILTKNNKYIVIKNIGTPVKLPNLLSHQDPRSLSTRLIKVATSF
jgi:hypothetical protein